jgi:hypothetical protein
VTGAGTETVTDTLNSCSDGDKVYDKGRGRVGGGGEGINRERTDRGSGTAKTEINKGTETDRISCLDN